MSHTATAKTAFTRTLIDQKVKGKGLNEPGFIFLVVVIIVTVMMTILLYLWSRLEMVNLGYMISKEDNRRIELLEENKILRLELANLKSPERIERIAEEKLGLFYPPGSQVIVIK